MMRTKLQVWAEAVKGRDGKCMTCGTTNDLHAHHKLPKSSHPELSLDVENGKTLCYRCHKAEHESNRFPRIRSNKPQRRTMQTQIAALTDEVDRLTRQNRRLLALVRECERGVCQMSFQRRKVLKAVA